MIFFLLDLQQGVSPQEALTSLSNSQKGLEDEEQFTRPPTYSDLHSWSSEREQVCVHIVTDKGQYSCHLFTGDS